MKKRKLLRNLIVSIFFAALLAGCGGEAEEAVNKYTAASGMFAVSLPGKWSESDNMGLDTLLSLSRNDGAEAIVLGLSKSQLSGIGSGVESLEDFYEYADSLFLQGAAASTSLSDTSALPLSGFDKTLAKEGTMTQANGASGKVFMQCAESENAYYLIMLSATSKYDKLIASMRENIALEELSVPETEALTDTLCWFNACYAVITSLNGGNLNYVAGYEPGDMIKELEQQLLERDWEITDQASLEESIDWLLTEGHNQSALDDLTELGVQGMDRDELIAAMEASGYDEDEQVMVLAAYDAEAAYGGNAIAGWDLSRAMSLMGWGYLAGYYTYEEAMDKSLETAQMIQQTFDSWDDFWNSYFLGYSYWSGQDLEDTDSQAYQRRQVYEMLKSDTSGVFRADWNTPLVKEW